MANLAALPYLQSIALKRDKIDAEGLGFDKYPFAIPAVRELDHLAFHPQVTFFVGENGSGKSTLLEAIAVAMGFNPEGGTKFFNFNTRESHSSLHQYLRLAKSYQLPKDGFFLRAESFFNVATAVDNYDAGHRYGGRSLHEQSHGESFFSLMTNRFLGKGLYLLDEPEAALSPMRQLAMLRLIRDLARDDSQFIIATHSPILLAYPNATIIHIDGVGLSEVRYQDTEHYAITKAFLDHPERMLRELFAEDDE